MGGHLLTAFQEIGLSRRIERGDLRAKDEMVESNLRLVASIARRYRGLGVPFEDLVQEASVGLVRAVEKFDYRRGIRFSTYAAWWIRRALVDALGEADAIRLPARTGRRMAAVGRAESELRRRAPGRAISSEAVADRTGLSAQSVTTLRAAARVTVSLDQEVGKDCTPLSYLVADPDPVDPWRHVAEQETRRQVQSMLELLPHRHREVLVRRYGLHGGEVQSHAEIGTKLGLGQERSRQLEREALHRLRDLGGGRWRGSYATEIRDRRTVSRAHRPHVTCSDSKQSTNR